MRSKSFIRRILVCAPLLMATALLNSGCLQPKSSQPAKSQPTINSIPTPEIEIIPGANDGGTTVKTNTAITAHLLPNQYQGMPPRVGQVLQYCQRVCTDNWSGSLFGGERNPSNICMGGMTDDATGSLKIIAHITQSNPDGFRMDNQVAPDGSRCIYQVEQCTVSNGCLEKK